MEYSRVFKMSFASVYPHYISKAEKKGKTKQEVNTIIFWLTRYDKEALEKQITNRVDFETFFLQRLSQCIQIPVKLMDSFVGIVLKILKTN